MASSGIFCASYTMSRPRYWPVSSSSSVNRMVSGSDRSRNSLASGTFISVKTSLSCTGSGLGTDHSASSVLTSYSGRAGGTGETMVCSEASCVSRAINSETTGEEGAGNASLSKCSVCSTGSDSTLVTVVMGAPRGISSLRPADFIRIASCNSGYKTLGTMATILSS